MKNLKNIRATLGLTQKELAKKIKSTQSAVSHWETGYADVPKDMQERIKKLISKK